MRPVVTRLRGMPFALLIVGINVAIVAAVVLATSSGPRIAATPGSTPSASTSSPVPAASPSPAPLWPAPATATPMPSGTDLRAMFAAGKSLNIVVLGDQTGVDDNDWVETWVRTLADVRPVRLLRTRESDPTTYRAPARLGEASTSGTDPVTVRNASAIGATPRYAAERVAALVPADTDAVIVNFGRSNTRDTIAEELTTLMRALKEAAPSTQVRVVVQPARQDGEPTLDATVRAWGARNDATLVDVAQVFDDEGLTETVVSTRDPLSVNLAGARAWAAVVQEDVLGPLEPR